MSDENTPPGDVEVSDHPDIHRYELRHGGSVVSFATYRLHDDVLTIPHVETAPEHRGQGYADALLSGIVDDVRPRGLKIRPVCPFAADFFRSDPSTHDLIAD